MTHAKLVQVHVYSSGGGNLLGPLVEEDEDDVDCVVAFLVVVLSGLLFAELISAAVQDVVVVLDELGAPALLLRLDRNGPADELEETNSPLS